MTSELRKKIFCGLSFGIPEAGITTEIMNEFCELESERDQLRKRVYEYHKEYQLLQSQLTTAKDALRESMKVFEDLPMYSPLILVERLEEIISEALTKLKGRSDGKD